ncbi:hypothetical protein EWB00_010463, partial [Schistosoma japonicum]
LEGPISIRHSDYLGMVGNRDDTKGQVNYITVPFRRTAHKRLSIEIQSRRDCSAFKLSAIPKSARPRVKVVGSLEIRRVNRAGSLFSQDETDTNLPSFSGSSRNTLPRCGQPGSGNRPHTRDPSKIINLISPYQNKEAARFTLRVSGSPDAASRGLAGVGIALSRRAELALLDWIPVDSRLCANRDTRRCLFVVSAYAPTDCSSDEVKDELYSKLTDLLQKTRRSDIVIMAGDLNAQ